MRTCGACAKGIKSNTFGHTAYLSNHPPQGNVQQVLTVQVRCSFARSSRLFLQLLSKSKSQNTINHFQPRS
jgi:hypothetical protein